jgi:hypothetical protein
MRMMVADDGQAYVWFLVNSLKIKVIDRFCLYSERAWIELSMKGNPRVVRSSMSRNLKLLPSKA